MNPILHMLGSGGPPTDSQRRWTVAQAVTESMRDAERIERARVAARQPIVTSPLYASCPIRLWRKHALTTDPVVDAEGCQVGIGSGSHCGVSYIVAYGYRLSGMTDNGFWYALCSDHAAGWAAMMGYRDWQDAAEGLLYRECAVCGEPVADPAAVALGGGYLHADCAATFDGGAC